MRWIGFIGLLLVSSLSFGQDVSFVASAPNIVEVGEQFRLAYAINKKGSNLQVPTLDGFNLLMGPSTSSSTSFSSINGQVSQSVAYTYTYVLEGTKEGNYTVAPATIVIDGKQYKSNVLTIQVVKGGGNASQGRGQSSESAQVENAESVNANSLFVRVDVSRRSLYIGESVVATVKVYSKVNLVNFGRNKFPSFSGFLAEEMPTPERIELVRETYDGQIYNTGVIRKMLLFPQHTGEITIEPFELECIVREKLSNTRNFFDDFFGNYRDVKVARKSPPIRIEVKELPTQGKPLGFSGTVGNIAMSTSVSTDTIKANDAITYKIVFSGSGNLKLIEKPNINFPPDFEVYDPKITKDIKNGVGGMTGMVTFEYLIIPRYSGDYKIPAMSYSFFNPQTASYKTLQGEEYNIHVLKGAEKGSGSLANTGVQSFKKEDVKMLGEDIRYIKTGNLGLHAQNTRFYGTIFYLLAFLIPLVLFILGMIVTRRRIKANADIVRVKNKAANKMARKRMKVAEIAMKNHNGESFYDEVLKSMWGYVSYKLNIDRAELNKENISDLLKKKGVDDTLINDFIEVLNVCEFARYAPGSDSAQEMDKIYANGIGIITKLDKAIR